MNYECELSLIELLGRLGF